MRTVIMALFSALLAALFAGISWVLVFAHFDEVPKQTAFPENWSSLSVDAQNEWLLAHAVTKSGFQALQHVLDHLTTLGSPAAAFIGVLFFAALVAIALNAFFLRRPP